MVQWLLNKIRLSVIYSNIRKGNECYDIGTYFQLSLRVQTQ
jgi:hypothetical protein